ncbi:MAG: class II fumarate hydratase [Thermoproteus sp.]
MDYTDRARRLFLETGTKFPRRVIWAMGLLKYAYAKANYGLGLIDAKRAAAIMEAARKVAEGTLDREISVDVFQTGSGTGLNMNLNEVIAAEASRLAGVQVHPNDHVNMGQSSNDVVPSAIRIAAYFEAKEGVLKGLDGIIEALREKEVEHRDVVKAGRTHLRDALPVTLGQELGAYADAFEHDRKYLLDVLEYVKELPLGGTAVGTGANAPKELGLKVIEEINAETGADFKRANPFRAMRLLTDLLLLSSIFRNIAIELYRLGQDLRLMFSGPFTGIGEIELPTQEEVPGSSIMPGKTNPVTVEAVMLAAVQIAGLDQANAVASALGEFELSMGIPLMGFNIVGQAQLLSEALKKFTEYAVRGLKPHVEKMRNYAENSPALITALAPVVGYEKATELAKKISKGTSIKKALEELGLNPEELVERLAGLRSGG